MTNYIPRTWTLTGTASGTAATKVVGSSADPFGPSTVVIKNTHASASLSVAFAWGKTATTATETNDGNSFAIAAGETVVFNFDTQNSRNQLNISVISASSATYSFRAVQAQ